jgi:hypothetical protein
LEERPDFNFPEKEDAGQYSVSKEIFYRAFESTDEDNTMLINEITVSNIREILLIPQWPGI